MEGAGHQKTHLPKVSFTTCRIRLLLLTVNELFPFVFGSDPLLPQQSGKKKNTEKRKHGPKYTQEETRIINSSIRTRV